MPVIRLSSAEQRRRRRLPSKTQRGRAGHDHVPVARARRCRGCRRRARPSARRSVSPRRCAATSAAQAPLPQARVMPAPRSQTRSRIWSGDRAPSATPILARSGNSGSCSSTRPERGEIDRLGVGDKEGRVRVADIGADRRPPAARAPDRHAAYPSRAPAGCRASRCAPAPYRPRRPVRAAPRRRAARRRSRSAPARSPVSRGDQPGDAARGVAAGLGLAAVGVADAHEDLRRRVARRLEHDQLVAADAGMPVGQRARGAAPTEIAAAAARRARRNRCRARAF